MKWLYFSETLVIMKGCLALSTLYRMNKGLSVVQAVLSIQMDAFIGGTEERATSTKGRDEGFWESVIKLDTLGVGTVWTQLQNK